MTQKEILAIATNSELVNIVQDIYYVHTCSESQTVNEQKAAKKEMEHLAKILIEALK